MPQFLPYIDDDNATDQQQQNPVAQANQDAAALTGGGAAANSSPQPLPTIAAAPAQQPGMLPTVRPQYQPYQLSPIRQAREEGLENSLYQLQQPRPPATGFWGKAGRVLENIGNAAGEVILGDKDMRDIPGTNAYKLATIGNESNQLGGLQKQDLEEENAARAAEVAQRQANAAGLVLITPEMANELKQPSLAGQAVTQGVLQHLYTTSATDKTKEDTTKRWVALPRFGGPHNEPVMLDTTTNSTGYKDANGNLSTEGIQLLPSAGADKLGQANQYTGPQGEATSFDPAKGEYFYLDANGQRQTEGIKRFVNPNSGQPFVIPGDNGYSTFLRARPGQQLPNNAVTPSGFNSLNVPTSTTRTMIENAPGVMDLADKVNTEIDKVQGELGPDAGRWNDFWTGKVGTSNPDFKKLMVDTGLLETKLMRMHVGARGGTEILAHFHQMLNYGHDSPDNMKAALEEIRGYANDTMNEYRNGSLSILGTPSEGNGNSGGNNGGNNNGGNNAPPSGAKIRDFSQVK